MDGRISEAEQQRRSRQRAMGIADFCERYGPGRTKVYEEVKYGRLRARKIGKRTIITVDDAEDWLRSLPVIEAARSLPIVACAPARGSTETMRTASQVAFARLL